MAIGALRGLGESGFDFSVGELTKRTGCGLKAKIALIVQNVDRVASFMSRLDRSADRIHNRALESGHVSGVAGFQSLPRSGRISGCSKACSASHTANMVHGTSNVHVGRGGW